jgi:hypothetical protein
MLRISKSVLSANANQGKCDIIAQAGVPRVEILNNGDHHFLNKMKSVTAFTYLNRLMGGYMISIP